MPCREHFVEFDKHDEAMMRYISNEFSSTLVQASSLENQVERLILLDETMDEGKPFFKVSTTTFPTLNRRYLVPCVCVCVRDDTVYRKFCGQRHHRHEKEPSTISPESSSIEARDVNAFIASAGYETKQEGRLPTVGFHVFPRELLSRRDSRHLHTNS